MFFKIIMPNYNNEKWLDKCLTSIANQTFKDFKLIVVDDMSTDRSVDIIQSYQHKINMELIVSTVKVYNGGARNIAIRKEVPSEYTLFIDSDDWFYEDTTLEKLHKYLKKNPVDCLSLPYHIVYANSENDYYWKNKRNTVHDLVWDNCGACWTKCIKTKLIKEFPENTLMEDTVQHINQCNYVKTLDTYPRPVISYNRTNVESLTHPQKHVSIKWQTSIFRYLADLMELWCPDADCEERRQASIETAKREIERGVYIPW